MTEPPDDVVAELFEQVPERQEMPPELVRSLSAGLQTVVRKRLDREEDLVELAPQLGDWLSCYRVPPGPLRARRRRAVTTLPFEERQAHSSQQERIMRALAAVVAESGYPATTVAAVVDRASTSQRSFYSHFKNKEDATVAALDSGFSHMLAAALPPFRQASEWKHAIYDAIEAMFAFGAEEPEYARLGGLELDTGAREALDRHGMLTEGIETLLAPGYELNPNAPPIAAEAAGSAVSSLLYDHAGQASPATLPDLVPTLVYVALVPFIGGGEAYEVAID